MSGLQASVIHPLPAAFTGLLINNTMYLKFSPLCTTPTSLALLVGHHRSTLHPRPWPCSSVITALHYTHVLALRSSPHSRLVMTGLNDRVIHDDTSNELFGDQRLLRASTGSSFLEQTSSLTPSKLILPLHLSSVGRETHTFLR